jgi:hypothetical protein
MKDSIGGLVLALLLLGGCAGLLNPYPEAKFDCEERDCTHCVPIKGAPRPKGHLCSVNRDQNPPPPAVPGS